MAETKAIVAVEDAVDATTVEDATAAAVAAVVVVAAVLKGSGLRFSPSKRC
jgi:hypothetical protein